MAPFKRLTNKVINNKGKELEREEKEAARAETEGGGGEGGGVVIGKAGKDALQPDGKGMGWQVAQRGASY